MTGEKPYEPTHSRLERAKREGDSARSQELATATAFAGAALGVALSAAPLGCAAGNALVAAAAHVSEAESLAQVCAWMVVPGVLGAAGAVTAGAVQTGGVRLSVPSLKFDRLAPGENLKRMFSREAAVGVARAGVAFALGAAVLSASFAAVFAQAMHALGPFPLAAAAWNGSLRSVAVACAIGAAFGLIDYRMQVSRRLRRLRMSFEELKRDQKEHDGDPLTRGRRRSLHRRFARGSLLRIREAAFVIANPTHVAVALEYGPPRVPVPRVIVRAAGDAALRARELAAHFKVPVVENVELARRLYADALPGDYVPRDLYVAIAEIIAALRRKGELYA